MQCVRDGLDAAVWQEMEMVFSHDVKVAHRTDTYWASSDRKGLNVGDTDRRDITTIVLDSNGSVYHRWETPEKIKLSVKEVAAQCCCSMRTAQRRIVLTAQCCCSMRNAQCRIVLTAQCRC